MKKLILYPLIGICVTSFALGQFEVVQVVLADDDAANYGVAWAGNGGTGLDNWVFAGSGGGEFLASTNGNADLNWIWSSPEGKAWGTWANGVGVPAMAAFRGFGWNGSNWVNSIVATGDTFSISMEHGDVAGSGAIGFVLRTGNAASSVDDYNTGARLEFGYWGSDQNYSIYDGSGSKVDSGVTARNTGLNLTVAMTGTNTYSLSIYDATNSALLNNLTGLLSGSGNINSLSVYNRNSDYPDNAYFNNIRITSLRTLATGAVLSVY